MNQLDTLLHYYENQIDLEHQQQVLQIQTKLLHFEPVPCICMKIDYPSPELHAFSMEEIQEDMSKMMYNELLSCKPQIETKGYGIPMIRANYGVGTFPSLFGLTYRIINGSMPWVNHVSKEEASEILSRGIPDFTVGFGKKLFETYAFYQDVLSAYPNCQKAISLYHPDLQGPFDIAHLIYGPDIYMALYDDPEFIHSLMQLITDTYIQFMKKFKERFPDTYGGNCYHWGFLFGGAVVIRNDSAVNLSEEMYREFVKKYDDQIIEAFDGASIHFCGQANQWLFTMASSGQLKGMNFGYMEKLPFGSSYLDLIMPEFTKRKLPVIGYVLSKKDFEEIRFENYPTGISYLMSCASREDANRLLNKCRQIDVL